MPELKPRYRKDRPQKRLTWPTKLERLSDLVRPGGEMNDKKIPKIERLESGDKWGWVFYCKE